MPETSVKPKNFYKYLLLVGIPTGGDEVCVCKKSEKEEKGKFRIGASCG